MSSEEGKEWELPPMSEVKELLITREDFDRIIKEAREYYLADFGGSFEIDFTWNHNELWKNLRDER